MARCCMDETWMGRDFHGWLWVVMPGLPATGLSPFLEGMVAG
ncbi:MAG: hypothetical protein P1V20_05800 [Verrucomicrobiales bacterium]|nr:hypothetical protein [Verrucomicrobiales bacterium]